MHHEIEQVDIKTLCEAFKECMVECVKSCPVAKNSFPCGCACNAKAYLDLFGQKFRWAGMRGSEIPRLQRADRRCSGR